MKILALDHARRRWIRTHRIDGEIPARLLPSPDDAHVWPRLATAQVEAPRREKRRWRRRVSRARHTKHAHRAAITFKPLPFHDGPTIGVYSDPDDCYPTRIIRAPWARDL